MRHYTVRTGEYLSVIAVRFHTTVTILADDNPWLPANLEVQPGDVLTIRSPIENARKYSSEAQRYTREAYQLAKDIKNTDYIIEKEEESTPYHGRTILPEQKAFLIVDYASPLIAIYANGYEREIRLTHPGEYFHVYDTAVIDERTLYLVDDFYWIEEHPYAFRLEYLDQKSLAGKISLPFNRPSSTVQSQVRHAYNLQFFNMAEFNVNDGAVLTYGPVSRPDTSPVAPRALLTRGPEQDSTPNRNISPEIFETADKRRPSMLLRNPAGESTRVELRGLTFGGNYRSDLRPQATNRGWTINVGPDPLSTINFSGFLLSTAQHDEFIGFMNRYHKYMTTQRSGDYLSRGICILYYNKTEYHGLVQAFNFSEQTEQKFQKKFNINFLVIKEKDLSQNEYNDVPQVVNRPRSTDEFNYRSDLRYQLANAITGSDAEFYD